MPSELSKLLSGYLHPPARGGSYQCECEWCGYRWKDKEQNPATCPRCGSLGEHETEEN